MKHGDKEGSEEGRKMSVVEVEVEVRILDGLDGLGGLGGLDELDELDGIQVRYDMDMCGWE